MMFFLCLICYYNGSHVLSNTFRIVGQLYCLISFSQLRFLYLLFRVVHLKLWLSNLNFIWYVLHFMLFPNIKSFTFLFSGFAYNVVQFLLVFIKCLLCCLKIAARYFLLSVNYLNLLYSAELLSLFIFHLTILILYK